LSSITLLWCNINASEWIRLLCSTVRFVLVQKQAVGRKKSERAKVRVLCFVWVGTVGEWLAELGDVAQI